jgi:hypothetical protein
MTVVCEEFYDTLTMSLPPRDIHHLTYALATLA